MAALETHTRLSGTDEQDIGFLSSKKAKEIDPELSDTYIPVVTPLAEIALEEGKKGLVTLLHPLGEKIHQVPAVIASRIHHSQSK